MTALRADQVTLATRRPGANFGAWRAVTAIPAMVGSLLLLVVLFGWMGRWEGLVLLGWLASGVAVFTQAGEQLAVRVGCGFRRPTRMQAARLAPLWAAALQRCSVAPGEVDLYVQRSAEVNAYAAGGRSVAVTAGVLAKFQAHRHPDDYLISVLAHELGHYSTKATRLALVTIWLAAPWRFAARLLLGVAAACAGRQPRRLLACVIVAAVVIAVVQAVQQRQWVVAISVSALALCTVVCPLADAALSRRSEYAADRYATDAGLGLHLAAALQTMDVSPYRSRTWTARALSRHPSLEDRIEALDRSS